MPEIQPETPEQAEVALLLAQSDAFSQALYPPEENYLLDAAALAGPDVRFFVARLAGRAVGCGALVLHADGSGEIKRMFVAPEARGHRIGSAILARLEEQALRDRVGCLRLETGPRNTTALDLYRRAGFRERGPFANYPSSPSSVFMEKAIGPGTSTEQRRLQPCSSAPGTS